MSSEIPLYTVIFITSIISTIISVDIWLEINNQDSDTISEVLRNSARRWPILYTLWGLLFGVLLGHWFW